MLLSEGGGCTFDEGKENIKVQPHRKDPSKTLISKIMAINDTKNSFKHNWRVAQILKTHLNIPPRKRNYFLIKKSPLLQVNPQTHGVNSLS